MISSVVLFGLVPDNDGNPKDVRNPVLEMPFIYLFSVLGIIVTDNIVYLALKLAF